MIVMMQILYGQKKGGDPNKNPPAAEAMVCTL